MASSKFPAWAIIAYRGLRAAVGAGIAQAVILQPDWSDPKTALRTIGVAFAAGFITALGKWVRDYIDSEFGLDEKSLVAQTMIV